MKISDIAKFTQAHVVAGKAESGKDFDKAFSSDLMSDVLTIDDENILLITGLSNL